MKGGSVYIQRLEDIAMESFLVDCTPKYNMIKYTSANKSRNLNFTVL